MSERKKLPKLTKNSKLTKFQEEINGIIEELLEEGEVDITDINSLIYAAATFMTLALNKPSKRNTNSGKVVLENKNAETDKQLEKRAINNS